jgi:hypothetical protein
MMGGVLSEADKSNLARAIMNLTGGERAEAMTLVHVASVRPNMFKGRTEDQDEALLRRFRSTVGEEQYQEMVARRRVRIDE